jgi:hypothetical protein
MTPRVQIRGVGQNSSDDAQPTPAPVFRERNG